MRRVLVLYAHPGQRHSQVNRVLAQSAQSLEWVSFVDLYADYPRFKINVETEQQRLREHDVIVLQFPLYWYSTPSLLKEWQDLVLAYGFAYGPGGGELAGKLCLLAVTAGDSADVYHENGLSGFRLRALLSPLEQTANSCRMRFLPPFVLFSALDAHSDKRIEQHVAAYTQLLSALRDDVLDLTALDRVELLSASNVPLREGAGA